MVINAVNNLQAIANTTIANPFPFLHQFFNNQIGYAETIVTAIQTGIENLATELAKSQTIIRVGGIISPLRPATIELLGGPLTTTGTTFGGIVPAC